MLKLTRDCEYALMAVLYLASQPEGKVSLIREIAEARDMPRTYLSKIMQRLARAGLIKSRRGARGGLVLGRSAGSITMKDVIEAVEGPIRLNVCLTGKGACPRDEGCPVLPVWVKAQKSMIEVLKGKTMAQLVKDGMMMKKGAGGV
ncbi:MAG: Rrf2 family transcriptional regulator [Deltaproteobacteria bacterium]|nr:Rrf2 family transcriptional regulator [Deltaproteobacteria bacterium]